MANKIKLTSDTISKKDIDSLCKWLKTYPKLTKGQLTEELERKFAFNIGSSYSIFVNSGSSANLLMLSTLIAKGNLKIGDRVGIPALCWSTDLAPVLQLGLVPVILDCSRYHLGIEISYLDSIIKEFDIKCIISVSVLGIPGQLDKLSDICFHNKTILLEDNCESLGSKFQYEDLGLYGFMSSWSTYFSHHISTIEGGFVTTDEYDTLNLMRSIRSHGWNRDTCTPDKGFYGPYIFHELGYNIRNTEIGAFLGLRQLEILDKIVETRYNNFVYYCEKMNGYDCYDFNFYDIAKDNERYVSSFGLPVIHYNRDKLAKNLLNAGIECRPLIAGSITEHPVAKKYTLLNKSYSKSAKLVHKHGLYLPNHLEITEKDINKMVEIIKATK